MSHQLDAQAQASATAEQMTDLGYEIPEDKRGRFAMSNLNRRRWRNFTRNRRAYWSLILL